MKLVQDATSLRDLRKQLQQARNLDELTFVSEDTLLRVLEGLKADEPTELSNALWLLSVLPPQVLRSTNAAEAIRAGLAESEADIVMTAAWAALTVGAELGLDREAILAARYRLDDASPEEHQAKCFLTGAAWMLASHPEDLTELSGFLTDVLDSTRTKSQLRTLAEVGRLPATTLPRLRELVGASDPVVQRLSIRVLGRCDQSEKTRALLESSSQSSDPVIATEVRLALKRLRLRKSGCATHRYCVTVSAIAENETTPAERIYATTESAIDRITAPLREQIKNAAHEILETEDQWLAEATDAEQSALLNKLTHLLAPYSVDVPLDRKADSAGVTEVAQSGDTAMFAPQQNHEHGPKDDIPVSAQELDTALASDTEFSDLATLCAAITSEPLFEMETEFQALGVAIRKLRAKRVTALVDSVNRVLASLTGRKLAKSYADRFVLQLRDMVAALGCQLFLDGRPVTLSVSKDARYQAARFAIREIGVSNKTRSATSASALPRFSLRLI